MIVDIASMDYTRGVGGMISERSVDGGWSETITTALGSLLYAAEVQFGRRDTSWTILGVFFGGRVPQIRFPDRSRKDIAIRLPLSATANAKRAIFNLAHEVIHLLSPSIDGSCLMLEEGLATTFSASIGDQLGLEYDDVDGAYIYARDTTAAFRKRFPSAILQARLVEPDLRRISPSLLLSVCPGLESDLAAQLCEPFDQVERRLGGPVRD